MAVGKYEVAYRVAGILNMFVYVPFSITLLPAAYKVYKQEGDKRFYGKLMTYITIILCWAGLGLSVLSKEVVIIFAQNESYHSVHFIVPLLIFSYVIIGMISVASLGMYLTNNTKWIAIITLLCACINILLNIFFIPQFGLVAAAINTVVAFIILLLLSIKFSNKYYRVNYDSLAVLKIIFLTIILYFAITLIDTESLLIDFASKFILALIFPSFLLLLKIFDANEKKFIKKIIYLINKPKELITFIKSESPNLN